MITTGCVDIMLLIEICQILDDIKTMLENSLNFENRPYNPNDLQGFNFDEMDLFGVALKSDLPYSRSINCHSNRLPTQHAGLVDCLARASTSCAIHCLSSA